MSRLALLLLLLRLTHVAPSVADRIGRLYEKLELLKADTETIQKPHEKLYEKLERLNSLNPHLTTDRQVDDDDEELLKAIQIWGMLDSDQLEGVMKELQSMQADDYSKYDKLVDSDDSDGEWNDLDLPEGDYPADFYADEEPDSSSTSRPSVITPSTLTRRKFQEVIVSAADSLAATNERPVIFEDLHLSPEERAALRNASLEHIRAAMKNIKCLKPQPRWFTVRHLAPAANILYIPPCVQLHRCAPDSGCCSDEADVCAPVRGEYVQIPFMLRKANENPSYAKIRFFNHTQCACVSRNTLQTTVRYTDQTENIQMKKKSPESSEEAKQRQNDWRASTEEPSVERDDATAPPQLRRCTCPTLFLAQPLNEGVCTCVCEWSSPSRRRECLSLARGREHFGMRDRVCIDAGDCNPPTCDYGAYDRSVGKCPHPQHRRSRRLRYYHNRRLTENVSD